MKRFTTPTVWLVVCGLMLSANATFASDLLTNPISSFSFGGNLSGSEGNDSGTLNTYSEPVDIPNQSLPFADEGTQTLNSGASTASYSIGITSDFQPIFDTLILQLDLGVSGAVTGSWDTWSDWYNDLNGSLTTFFELSEWSATEFDLAMAWGFNGDVNIANNTITIRGPLDADPANQTGFLFETVISAPSDWYDHAGVARPEFSNLVPGTYAVEFSSLVGSGATRFGNESFSAALDLANDVTVWVRNAIDPDACNPGVPCPDLADIDGQNGVQMNDFAAWYENPIDVTSDSDLSSRDEAAMAYLLGVPMLDENQNGMVDAVDVYLEGTAASPEVLAAKSITLHPAYPNPFNPMTVLAFSLPTAATVELLVFDLQGKRIRTLLTAANFSEGRHDVTWNGRNDAGLPVPAGVYFSQLSGGGDVQTGRMLLLK